jgi:hypothetical protein
MLCLRCSKEFVPSKRHRRECLECFRRSDRSREGVGLRAALRGINDSTVWFKTEAERDLTRVILQTMSDRAVFTLQKSELPALWGKHRKQVDRSLSGVVSSGLVREVMVREVFPAVQFTGVER